MITRGRCLALRPDVVATVLEDGAVLLDLETKYFYELNRTGWDIVALFETGAVAEDVLARCRARGAPPDDDDAIESVIATLIDEQLVADAGDDVPLAQTADIGVWVRPTIVRQAEPLQKIIISAFDPSVPLVE